MARRKAQGERAAKAARVAERNADATTADAALTASAAVGARQEIEGPPDAQPLEARDLTIQALESQVFPAAPRGF